MIKNKNAISYYDKLAKKITKPDETRNKAKDFSKYDIDFIKRFSGADKSLLDLGSGTGLLVNHLTSHFKEIVAVEKYSEFSKFITNTPNIKVVNSDIIEFETDRCFDLISLFGVMNYFNKEEAICIYKQTISSLEDKGKLIVKNQMGIDNDIVIDGFSEELQTDYYSEYRHVDKEIALLKSIGFRNIELVDIYPEVYNRWDNTHFYALVCEK